MSSTLLLGILIVLVLGLGVGIFMLARTLNAMRSGQGPDHAFVMLNQNLNSMNEKIDRTQEALHKNTDTINERLTNAAKVIAGVQKELGTVQERFKGFEEFSELMHPKMRGNIGEQILADMLGQVFSDAHYEMQYKFKDGQVVDAIIRSKAGLIPIDSKFPLENFKQLNRAENDDQRKAAAREFTKAVKRHIDDISKKYILPHEGTMGFAVMYVPSENVYYHIITDEEGNLMDHAKEKNVFVTSPQGLMSLLQVILMGLERAKLQEQAQKIWDILKGVQQESGRFGEALGILSGHLTRAKGSMDTVMSGYDKLTGKLDQVNLLGEAKTPIDES